jgi:hypothetical protein
VGERRQLGCQHLRFGIGTDLARHLTPEAFGPVAITGVYVALIQAFVCRGLEQRSSGGFPGTAFGVAYQPRQMGQTFHI